MHGHCHKHRGRRFARREPNDALAFGRHRGGGGSRSGLGRFFAHGDLRLVILHLAAEKPRHGYEIIKAIEDLVGGAYSPSPGVIYPTLTLLEELGHVVAETDAGNRKRYAVTQDGRAFIEAQRAALDPLLARMAEASRMRSAGDAPPIVRAMENLRLALRLRIEHGPLGPDQIAAIAAALDDAARDVERA